MAKFKVYAMTNKVGSISEDEIEIPDDELNDLEYEDIWNVYIRDVAFNLVELWFERID